MARELGRSRGCRQRMLSSLQQKVDEHAGLYYPADASVRTEEMGIVQKLNRAVEMWCSCDFLPAKGRTFL